MTMQVVPGENGAVEYVIPSDLKWGKQALEAIMDAVKKIGVFLEKEIKDIRLALDEAIVNAIKHGNQGCPEKIVRIHSMIDQARCRFRITDQGLGFDRGNVPDPLTDENLSRPSGRGLFLMEYYMDQVILHPPGNIVEMTKTPENSRKSRDGREEAGAGNFS